MNAPAISMPRAAGRPGPVGLVGALAGGILGLVLGIVVDAGIWLWAFAGALNGQSTVNVPLVVQVTTSGGDVSAQSGLGLLVIPLVVAALGVLLGLVIAQVARRRTR